MKNTIPVPEITFDNMPKAVAKICDEVSLMNTKLDDVIKNFEPRVPNEYLTRAQVAEMLKVDLSTIHNWCKKGKLNPMGIGNRVYFLRTEVEAAIVPLGKGGQDGN